MRRFDHTTMTEPEQPTPSKYHIVIPNGRNIAIGDGAKVVTGAEAPPSAVPPTVRVTLLTRTFPTAYSYQLDATTFPFIKVELDNTAEATAPATLHIQATIQNISDTAATTRQLGAGEQTSVALLPVVPPTAVATLTEIRPATLRVVVEQTAPTRQTLYDQTERIHLHARDTALIGVLAPNDTVLDLSDYLAAWVTPRTAEMEQLLRKAADHHPHGRLVGYQGAKTEAEKRQVVRAQVQAIFTALKEDSHLTYINSPWNLGAESGQIMQRVRWPSLVLNTAGAANCIDGAVLMASLLELAAIAPLLVIVPGHAFVGWRIWRGMDEYEFLETTMIGTADFDTAQRVGQGQYDKALAAGKVGQPLFDPHGFARLVDIAACRQRAIYPLQ